MSEGAPEGTPTPANQLPQPTFSITLHDPMIVVLDVSLPTTAGMEDHKMLRYIDRSNPGMQIDVALPLDLAEKIAERLTRRRSGLAVASAADLAKVGRQ